VVVENNSVGYTVLDKLIEKRYPNVYFSIKSSHEYVDQLTAENSTNSVPGFSTTSKTRPLIVAKLEEFIRNELIIIHSSRLLNELRTFVWNNGRPQAMRSYNDDLVMSLAIACWVKDTALTINSRELEYKKAFLNSITSTRTNLDTRINGMNGFKQPDKYNKSNIEKATKPFLWLYKG
jgi:hypothetical protein